jgi:hypothetical protein
MYDALTTTHGFACPTRGRTRVRLSRFRRLEELPGAHHVIADPGRGNRVGVAVQGPSCRAELASSSFDARRLALG